MSIIISLDQGTTSSRSIAFDQAGTPVASAQQEFQQIFPQPGWVEHDAQEIWASQLATLQNLKQKLHVAGVKSAQTAINSIAITNQRETTVLWERATGKPLANAIVWQDRRTAPACDALRKAGKAALIQRKTGLVLDAYFSGTKLAWLLDNIPGARQRAEKGDLCFGTIDSWLIYKLTGGHSAASAHKALHVTDASNASRTLLLNIHTGQWDDELLKLFNIPRAVLPKVMPSSGIVGMTDASLLGQEIPIAGIAGDQQAATFGQACFAPGMAKNTYGTGCFMLMNTGTSAVSSKNKLLTTVAWQGPAKAAAAYALEGSVFMGGATVQWLRDGLGMIQSASDVEALAGSVEDTGDMYLVPAFAGLGTPHWDSYARGTMVGMTRGTTRAHIARAALEAIALQSADVFDAMRADSGIALKELRVDGGACANNLLMQMQADFLGVPVVRPKVTETTALGAAYLAGLATGYWKNASEISAQWQMDRRFEPRMSASQRHTKITRWREALERSKGWAQ
ncbi:glycerol kinase GlpK [Variovorax sp. PCZ-1]|uniref:glycerol kinase GlpK n=1 Tax=Variovorax sp. PCZ-1 TaxID=2835533 RepID=UPI001BCE0D75|nr:glycerol kinase GlpK [Variovorax sp. PCZ-1]MBS7808675.1 glycerol kinase GlpK [Variovorax sp. PCZ-1]